MTVALICLLWASVGMQALGLGVSTVRYIRERREVKIMEQEKMIIVTGTPSAGFRFIGPVTPNSREAEQITDVVLADVNWWLAPIEDPATIIY